MLYLQNTGGIICAAQDTNIKGISAPVNSQKADAKEGSTCCASQRKEVTVDIIPCH